MTPTSGEYAVVIVALVLGACTPARFHGAATRVEDDSRAVELFRIAVLDMTEQFGATLRVDPRPVRILGGIGESMQYHAPSDAARERLAVLEDLGVDTATALPHLPDCDPVYAPPGHKRMAGCPPDLVIITAVDTVMAGPEPGQWLMRVKPTIYDDYGRSAVILDLILGRRGGEYVLIERIERLRVH